MPYKDPEKKKQRMREWRKRSIQNGYGKWLYRRRALRFEDALEFKIALGEIKRGRGDAREIAREALKASERRWDALGPPPGAKPEEQADESLLAAVSRSQLDH